MCSLHPSVAVGAPDECWPSSATPSMDYPRMAIGGGKCAQVYRVVYEQVVGPIPEGLTIDHLCRNPRCCNPAHLEPVTMRENVLRGTSPAAKHARKSECPKCGGEYVTRTTPSGKTFRRCLACWRETCRRNSAKYRARKKGAK